MRKDLQLTIDSSTINNLAEDISHITDAILRSKLAISVATIDIIDVDRSNY